MSISAIWLVPLAAAGAGALTLAVVAGALKREVDELHRTLRPLRTSPGRRQVTGPGRGPSPRS